MSVLKPRDCSITVIFFSVMDKAYSLILFGYQGADFCLEIKFFDNFQCLCLLTPLIQMVSGIA